MKLEKGARDTEVVFKGKDEMKINTFLVVIDRLSTKLNKRSDMYYTFNKRFQFLSNLSVMANEEIREKATELADIYQSDIGSDFAEECVHFKDLGCLKKIKVKEKKKRQSTEIYLWSFYNLFVTNN